MRRTTSNRGQPEGLAKQLADLNRLDGKCLKERWLRLYGAQPPPCLSSSLLLRTPRAVKQSPRISGSNARESSLMRMAIALSSSPSSAQAARHARISCEPWIVG